MGVYFQVSGLGNQEPPTGDQVQVRAPGLSIPPSVIDSAICHLPSIQSSIYFGWQVAAPGGGWREACPLSSVIDSVICHLSGHPSFRVPGDGPRGIGHSGIGSRLQAPAADI